MSNPLVKRDLVDAILELRADVEKQLQANKYYVALNKLDELLAAIRPLEIVEATAAPAETPKQEDAEPAPAAAIDGDSGRTWSGVVQEPVVEGDMARAP
jgi:DNA-binding protein H-NS